MAYRFDKKNILRRMHFKKPKKKSITQSLFGFLRMVNSVFYSMFKKIIQTFLKSAQLLKVGLTRHKFAFASAMAIMVAAGIALYQPHPSGEEDFTHEEIIVMPIDGQDQFIKFDEPKMKNSEVVDYHPGSQPADEEKTAFHSNSVTPGPELLTSQAGNQPSPKAITSTVKANPIKVGPIQKGAELIGIIETDDAAFQPSRISSRDSNKKKIQ